jgi:uncharacterized caspase-like protein
MFGPMFWRILICILLSSNSFVIASASEKRIALVIGNSAYRHAAVLANPKNDAADMVAALEKLRFTVIKGSDLDKSGMDRTIRQFAEAMKGAEIGLFYYAGHGLQVSGRNYLVPIDAELKTAESLDFEMVGLDVVQRIMEAASETNVLFLDACRDNPLSRNLARAMGTRSAAIGRGLSAQEAGAGTLISFSTQPGNVALDGTGSRNSPYAAALTKHITSEGKGLAGLLLQVRRDVMAATGKRQIPWEHSALVAEIVLAPEAPRETSAMTAPAPAVATPKEPAAAVSADKAPKTATNIVSAPDSPKQTVISVNVPKPGVVKLAKSDHSHNVYDETGTNRLRRHPFQDSIELPPGKYQLQDDKAGHMSAMLEIKGGDTVELSQFSGFVDVKGAKQSQQVYDETGTRRLTVGAFPDGVHLPPGRYRLCEPRTGQMSSGVFEIGAGETVQIDKISGSLLLKGAKHEQHIYSVEGLRLTQSPFKDHIRLPPGTYRLTDQVADPEVVIPFDIQVGQDTVIDFGG